MDKDFSKKNCLTDNERYADLINGLLLDGQQQVNAGDLQDMDTQGLGIRTLFARYRGGYRQLYRDLVKKVGMGVNFVVIGVENQEMVHYLMPMRSMSYLLRSMTGRHAGFERKCAECRDSARQSICQVFVGRTGCCLVLQSCCIMGRTGMVRAVCMNC